MLARSVRVPDVAQAIHQLTEHAFIARPPHSFFRTYTEHDFLNAAKRSGLRSHAGSGKLQPAPAESNLCRREHGDFAVRQKLPHSSDRIHEALESRTFIRSMHQAGCHVASIRAIDLHDRVGPVCKLTQCTIG